MAVRFHTRSPARCTIGGTGGSAVATGMGNCNYPWLDSHTFIWFRLLPPPLLAQAGSIRVEIWFLIGQNGRTRGHRAVGRTATTRRKLRMPYSPLVQLILNSFYFTVPQKILKIPLPD